MHSFRILCSWSYLCDLLNAQPASTTADSHPSVLPVNSVTQHTSPTLLHHKNIQPQEQTHADPMVTGAFVLVYLPQLLYIESGQPGAAAIHRVWPASSEINAVKIQVNEELIITFRHHYPLPPTPSENVTTLNALRSILRSLAAWSCDV